MNNEVDFEALLARTFTRAQIQTQLPVVFGGWANSSQQFSISQVAGGLTASLPGLVIRAGFGIGGLALESGRVATVPNYLDSSRITHHYDRAVASEQLRSIVAAPITVDRKIRGVLYGASRDEAPFGPRLFTAFQECTRQLAFELAVAEATERRLRDIETAAALEAPRLAHNHSEREKIRLAHAELLELARDTDDARLRAKLSELAGRFAEQPAASSLRVTLSSRETEVITLVALGCTNIEIAERLHLEAETVKSYLRNCMRKLEVHSRTAAVSRARLLGLLP